VELSAGRRAAARVVAVSPVGSEKRGSDSDSEPAPELPAYAGEASVAAAADAAAWAAAEPRAAAAAAEAVVEEAAVLGSIYPDEFRITDGEGENCVVHVGLGRIVASYYRSSTLYQIH
jgi:hypothetical protein